MEPLLLLFLAIVGICLLPVILPLALALLAYAAPIVAALYIYHWLAH